MTLDQKFTFGDKVPQELVVQLDALYDTVASAVNRKPDVVVFALPPTGSDINYQVGVLWIAQTTDRVYILTNKTATVATWVQIS
jgi:hypothetical protein